MPASTTSMRGRLLHVLACAILAACSPAIIPRGAGISAPTNDVIEQGFSAPRHAYVTDYGAGGQAQEGKLVQFDLKRGIVVEPGRVLVRGLHEPIGVVVGPDGLVYVAEVGYGHHVIDVYQITQSTAKLAHRIRFVPGFQPVAEYLAIGGLNYLYATMDYSNIAVFRPGEHGYVRTPHYLQNTGGAFQIGVDRFGDVYQPTTDHLYVHLGRGAKAAHAETRTVIPDTFYPGGSLIIARPGGDNVFTGPTYLSKDWVSLAVLPAHTWGHVKVIRSMILKNGCWARVAALGISIALADGYLYETCAYLTRSNKSVRGVWTFRADAGGVVNALGFARSPVVTPGDIAIGP